MTAIRVEVLWSSGCPHVDAAREAVLRVARAAGLTVELAGTEVVTQDEARERRLPGSPTVRVEGRDVEPGADSRGDFGLG